MQTIYQVLYGILTQNSLKLILTGVQLSVDGPIQQASSIRNYKTHLDVSCGISISNMKIVMVTITHDEVLVTGGT